MAKPFSEADSGGVELGDGTIYSDADGPMGRLYDIRVMRNKFDHIGIRPDLFGQGGALVVDYAQTAEVAGNMFDRVCAQGIDVHGAKQNRAATDRPFTRLLIHHNRAVDTLLNNDDFDGIEGVNITLKDYRNGPLENGTTGALHLNGTNQYAVLKNEDINRAVTLTGGRRNDGQSRTVSGADLSNPQIRTSSFLIEVYFKTAMGQTDAVLIQKINGTGSVLGVNQAGGVTLATTAGGATAWLASRSGVNHGEWHQVIAEADRKAGTFTLYTDGKKDASGPGLGADTSLANDADLYGGGAPNGHYLNGAIDFLRLARGTLADSKTTIEELHAWEFNRPFLDDFTGHR